MTPLQLGSIIPQNSAPVIPACFVENFASGLVPYAPISGNQALFSVGSSPYGQAITIAAQASSTVAALARSTASLVNRLVSVKFNVISDNNDDAGEFFLKSSGTTVLGFVPRREAVSDPSRRPLLIVDSESIFLGSGGEIAFNTWYQLDVGIITGAGNTTATVTRLSDNVIVIPTTALVSSHTPNLIDTLEFLADSGSGTTTCPASYADLDICPVYTKVVNLDGVINAGSTSAVGIELTGFATGGTYTLTEPAGQTFTAVSLDGATWSNSFMVQQGAGASVSKGDGATYASALLAQSAFPTGTLAGGVTNYTFWISDAVPAGNLGGLSIKITGP